MLKLFLFLPENDLHEFGLLFYQYVLKKAKIRTIYLGQSVPYCDIITTIKKFEPKYTVSSWVSPVAPKKIRAFYERLSTDVSKLGLDIQHLSGGYQVENNLKELEDILAFINDPKSILKKIQ